MEDVNDQEPTTGSFPAATKQVAGEINGVKTDITSISFSDKLMITITQNGRLAQWVLLILLTTISINL
jgi:proteasome assembly chaperone 3